MSTESPDPHHLVIGAPYATSFWVLYRIILTESSRRIELGVCRVGKVVQGNVRCDATEQSQNRRLSITTAIMGTVSLSIFTSSSGPSIYIFTNNEFEWTLYDDQAIRAVIPDEYVQNPNAWYVKVPLVNYVTVEMHQLDRVLRQFKFRQPIPMAPEVFDEEHKVDCQSSLYEASHPPYIFSNAFCLATQALW
ncbi:hypothetical protein PVK06_040379 [Gossypium arboreum]|uniref:Uncharacterized protein n=1 Tax=Gossypium arboreum TaxID=29729 RepID=A0ABR0N608_GOSAR|nr:hypothetical protein PVK06_040379 [Gossypium arboreum]